MTHQKYWYNARVVRVVDADTIEFDIDLGMHVTRREIVRLNRVDAWELRGIEKKLGNKAKKFVQDKMPIGSTVEINTYLDKTGKYGRLLADIYLPCGLCLNDALVENEHARYVNF
jgi:micrococcal nuclease